MLQLASSLNHLSSVFSMQQSRQITGSGHVASNKFHSNTERRTGKSKSKCAFFQKYFSNSFSFSECYRCGLWVKNFKEHICERNAASGDGSNSAAGGGSNLASGGGSNVTSGGGSNSASGGGSSSALGGGD